MKKSSAPAYSNVDQDARAKMAVQIGIAFPPESVALRRHLQPQQHLTPTERLLAAEDLSCAVAVLAQAGGMRKTQLMRQNQLEKEWQRRMMEFIKKHAAPR